MEDASQLHNPREKSLAFLNQQAKVSNFAFDVQQHQSKQPSDLQAVNAAQVVTENKDNFLESEQPAINLQSGPPKKYIDQTDNNNNNNNNATDISNIFDDNTNSNTNPNTNNNNNNNDIQTQINTTNKVQNESIDAFVASNNDQQQKNDYESFFNDNEPQTQQQQQQQQQQQNNNNIQNDNQTLEDNKNEFNEEEKQETETEAETTNFLTVWQEQHRKMLLEKAKKERESKDEILEKGRKDLDEFNKQRQLRIEQTRKDAKMRENDLREDYNSVFKHGTIWQQVAKLVDLQSKNKNIERMRDLLIILKNEDEKKSEK